MIDWSFMDDAFPGCTGKATVFNLIRHPTFFLGDLYKCSEFAERLWELIAKGIPRPPNRYLTELERRAVSDHTAVHCIYFFALEQIGHHIVIETRAGSARVYQCYVELIPDENGDSFGYSAREWVRGLPDDPDDPLAEGVLAARNSWAGESPIDRQALLSLLDLIYRLKDLASNVAATMFEQLPDKFKEIDAKLQADRTSTQWEEKSFEFLHGGLIAWSRNIINEPGCVTKIGLSEVGMPTVIRSSLQYKGTPFEFTLLGDVVDPFVNAYVELIGYEPQAPVFMMLLHHSYSNDKDSAHGWGIRAANIPH